jgi:ribosome-associated protein
LKFWPVYSKKRFQRTEAQDLVQSKTIELALLAADAAQRNDNAILLKVTGLSSYTDYILIVSGDSDRQVQAIADRVLDRLRSEGNKPIGVEGERSGWVLLDFGDVVVHVFRDQLREFYDLEGLWIDAPRVELDVPKTEQ